MSFPQQAPELGARPAAGPPARLVVRSVRLDDDVDLLSHIPSAASAVWLHHGQGFVGAGTAVRITATGPERFATASRAFRELVDAADVEDDVRLPGSGLTAFGTFSYADSSDRPSTLLVPRDVLGVSDGAAFWTSVRAADEPVGHDTWRDVFSSTPRGRAVDIEVDPDHTPDEYQGLVAQAVSRIASGQAEKVVLSETSTVTASEDVDPSALVRRLADRYPSTWAYRIEDVVGASPEMLAQTGRGRVFSRVLAGTRPVADGGELAEDERRAFRADAKERAEHAFAIDSVTRALATVADEVDASEEPFVLRLPGLEHLASDVRARLRPGLTSLDVAAVLHPSAAVSGTPRDRADAIIGELEAHDRGGYAAPVGWMDAHGHGQWAIALRMAHLLEDRVLRLQAGGGLVGASDPVTEHAEVLAKTRPVLSALRALGS